MGLARFVLAASALALLAGCQTQPANKPQPVVSVAPPTKGEVWQGVASTADAARLANITGAWAAGLADARKANFVSAIRDEGVLLKTDAALPRPAPTPGSYNCRLVRLGSTGKGKPAFEKFKPFFCYVEVEGDLLTIVKQTGNTRPAGRLWEDDNPQRLVFLGSLALGDEDAPLAYGEDPKRDMAGIFERIAPFKWRLVIPWPQDGAKLQVFELTPVADQPK
ncbi:DUF4893 domain-containing protein [Sphingomonas alba]|uniref:DUF4893 domain-containing protein n=1 Tax=Sphingomonas alba TaxID=2908208 RepID=A0ABT0RPW6_9SPHN|nr:DUF4893 domain-containing protein [Sphingomonas alba]MCL6684698.1 DUF4893 domain-containing protein [Sphingomonas alba]